MSWYSRSDWGADPPEPGGNPMGPVSEVYVHHYDSGITAPVGGAAAARVRSGQAYHVGLGWADIGYSWLVADDGNVYEGRGWRRTGAHTYGYNSKGYGVCWLGDSNVSAPSAAALGAIVEVILTGIRLGHITPAPTIVTHHDRVPDTTCCGPTLTAAIPHIRAAVTTLKPPEVDELNSVQADQLATVALSSQQQQSQLAALQVQVADIGRRVDWLGGWLVDVHKSDKGDWLAVAPGTPAKPGWSVVLRSQPGLFAHAIEAAAAVRPDGSGRTIVDRIVAEVVAAMRPAATVAGSSMRWDAP